MCAARILTELPVEVVRWHWRTKFKSFCPIVRLPLHLSKERAFETSWQFQKLTWSVFPSGFNLAGDQGEITKTAGQRIESSNDKRGNGKRIYRKKKWPMKGKYHILKLSSSPPKNGCWGDELFTLALGPERSFSKSIFLLVLKEGKSWKKSSEHLGFHDPRSLVIPHQKPWWLKREKWSREIPAELYELHEIWYTPHKYHVFKKPTCHPNAMICIYIYTYQS